MQIHWGGWEPQDGELCGQVVCSAHVPVTELQIVFRYHGPNDPWLCKMMGQFLKGWVNDNLKCTHLILLVQIAPAFLRPHVHCPHEWHVLEAWSIYADSHELVTVFLCEGTSSLCIDVVLHRKWPSTVCCVNRQGKSTGCELLKVWKVFRVEPADGLPQTHKVVSGEQLTQDHSFQKSPLIHGLFSVDSRFCACGLVIPPWLWVCFLIGKLSKKFLNFFHTPVIQLALVSKWNQPHSKHLECLEQVHIRKSLFKIGEDFFHKWGQQSTGEFLKGGFTRFVGLSFWMTVLFQCTQVLTSVWAVHQELQIRSALLYMEISSGRIQVLLLQCLELSRGLEHQAEGM